MPCVLLPGGQQGLADRSRVMSEIVYHGDSADDGPHFHSALHAPELGYSFRNRGTVDSQAVTGCDHSHAVSDVEMPGKGAAVPPKCLAFTQSTKGGRLTGKINIGGKPSCPVFEAKAFDAAKSAGRQLSYQSRIPTRDQVAGSRDQVDQAAERILDCFYIAVNKIGRASCRERV